MFLRIIAVLGLCLSICSGQLITNIEMTVDGAALPATNKIAGKADGSHTIRCTFDYVYSFAQTAKLVYKAADGQEITVIADAQTSFTDPFDDTTAYRITKSWNPTVDNYIQLELLKTSSEDAGEYSCRVEAANGQAPTAVAEKKINLEVFAKNSEVVLESVVDGIYAANADSDTTIVCNAYNGSLPSKMSIKVAGELLTDLIVTPDGDTKVYRGESIHTFTTDDNGKEIKCETVVPGFDGEASFSLPATISVRAKPVVDCPATAEANNGDPLKIECTVSGQPKPELSAINWGVTLDVGRGYGLTANDESKKEQGVTSSTEDIGEAIKVTLSFEAFDDSNSAGKYTLSAVNAGGSADYEVIVSKKNADTVRDPNNSVTGLNACTSLLILITASLALF